MRKNRIKHNSLLPALFLLVALMLSCAVSSAAKMPISSTAKVMTVGQKKIVVNIVEIMLSDSRVEVSVGLAKDHIGEVEELSSMVVRLGAKAAINGTFFDAYNDGPPYNPVGTVISNGKFLHKGGTGTVLGIGPDKSMEMSAARFKIIGGVDGSWKWPNNWYAHHVNRASTAENSAILYTPEWSGTVGGNGISSVVVSGGTVQRMSTSAVKVPEDGFVLCLRGSEKSSLLSRFTVGCRPEWKVVDSSGNELKGLWKDVMDAIGAGPKLVEDGKVCFSTSMAMAEGFTEAKILSQSMARSAVGLTKDGRLLLITADSAKMSELAVVMISLGAIEAMNLDGGASSGLWYDGAYLTKPGRAISNALLIYVR
ncbi:MAG TPA: phosphodiester glycosidase family protein [Bacillota bacterium]|nr:phosphodiester glycosidase family protein [Bacillota bacterium]HPM64560.1 phosphodiester glycosidase family protein [Bacillota bacterium]